MTNTGPATPGPRAHTHDLNDATALTGPGLATHDQVNAAINANNNTQNETTSLTYATKADLKALSDRIAVLEGAAPPPVVVPPPVIVPPPTSGTQPPSSIDRTGNTDVSAALNSWLVGLPAGAVADLAFGVYLVSAGQVKLSGRKNLAIQNGTLHFGKVLTGSSAGAILLDQQAGGISLRSLSLIGAATGAPGVAESNHAIQAQGCQGLVVDHCTIAGFGGDGIYSGGYVNPTWTHDLTVTNSSFSHCGRMGLGVADGLTNALIDGNTFDVFGWYATLDIEPNGVAVGSPAGPAHFENIRFTNNKIGRGNSAKLTFVVSTASNTNQAAPVVSGIVCTGNKTLYADTPWNPSISGWSSAVSMSGNS